MSKRKSDNALNFPYKKGKPSQAAKRRMPADGEVKFFDTSLSFTVDTTAEIPATGQLSLIPQGDTQSTRSGRKCLLTSIQIRGTISLIPAAAATSADVAYLYLIHDKQANGAAATVADSNTGIFTGSNLAKAMLTLANSERFKILKKWVIPLSAQAGVTTAYNNIVKPIEFYKKLNIPLDFDAAVSTGAITTLRSNNLFLVAGSAAFTDDLIYVEGVCRLRFND